MLKHLRKTIICVERHPALSFLVLAAVVVPFAVYGAYWYVDGWQRAQISSILSVAASHQQIEGDAIRENIENEFNAIDKFSWTLANDPRLQDALRSGDKEQLQRLSEFFKVFASGTGFHRVFALDRSGTCVASNDFENKETLVGVSFADRRYFRDAFAGNPTVEFVVGRVSTIPGFHFSRPVYYKNEIIGVITAKIDTFSLAKRIRFPRGFVTDGNGVVILTDRPDLLLGSISGTPSADFGGEEIRRIYRQDMLKRIALNSVSLCGFKVYDYGGDGVSSLLHVVDISSRGLLVYHFSPLDGYHSVLDQFSYRFALTSLNAVLAVLFVVVVVLYMLRDYVQKQKLLCANAELERLALYDTLTGCYNRRKFEEQLRTEFNRKRRTGHELSLAIIDIDKFKLVNDTYGHDGGDTVLKRFVAIAKTELRDIDFFARIGGEEFAIIFPFIGEKQASVAVARLLEAVKSTPVEISSVQTFHSFSAGVGSLESSEPEEEQHFQRRVDLALYVAKKCGRSRVVRVSSIRDVPDLAAFDVTACDSAL